MRTPFRAGVLAIALLGAAAAQSQSPTDTTTFKVKLTITESCDIHTSAPTDVNFGSIARTTVSTSHGGTGQLNVTCSLGTQYTIGLDGGVNSTATAAAPVLGDRRMKTTSAAALPLVPYDLFQDTSGTFWGNTSGSWQSGRGTGAAQAYPVYGLLTDVNFSAGVYEDTVTATITY